MNTEKIPVKTLLKKAHEGWEALQAMLAQFDDAQMTETHPPDGWSVKDLMAHIAYWENYSLQRLQEASRGEKPQLLGEITEEELHRINAQALEHGRTRALDQVKETFWRTHQRLVAEIQAVPEDETDPWWSVWPDHTLPRNIIVWNTFEHYEEHLADARKWVAG